MNINTFNEIFDKEIMPFIKELQENNSKIKTKDLVSCKQEIFKQFNELNSSFKNVIFSKDSDVNILDRHKIASCICGAFLMVSVFNKQELVDYIKETKKSVEHYFFYVNEFVAFYAGCKFLSFYMVSDNLKRNQIQMAIKIIERFPILPQAKNTLQGSYSNLLFYLSRIKDENEIGLKHFDKYSYSWNFYMLEEYFNNQIN